MIYKTIIIGGGPAGYSAALYCARAGLKPLIVEKLAAGGQMNLTSSIDNYPGIPEVDGFTLADAMKKQAESFGATSKSNEVKSLELLGDIKKVHLDDGTVLETETIILAMGANARKIGLPEEDNPGSNGIHYCAACDGMWFRGKDVALAGGGNTALEDAILLSNICNKVYLIHRRDEYRADRIYVNEIEERTNIIPVLNSVVKEVSVEEGTLRNVITKNKITGEEKTLPVSALFVSIGRVPDSSIAEDGIKKDNSGYIEADESTVTSIPGVFAAGDIRTTNMRQVVTAASDGARSSVSVMKYLAAKKNCK